MGNPLVRFCVGAGEQLKVWLRSCGTAGKPGGKQRKQTSAYSHGRPRSTRPKIEYSLAGILKDTLSIHDFFGDMLNSRTEIKSLARQYAALPMQIVDPSHRLSITDFSQIPLGR